MADMKKKRTELIRVGPEQKKWIEDLSRFKSFQEKVDIHPSRIVQAIFNLRNKYPIDDEIKLSKLGKWKSK